MNIVKIKDIQLDERSGLTEKQIELFNSLFSGRYAHAINWTYCIPFEDITKDEAVALSQSLTKTLEEATEPVSEMSMLSDEASSWELCTSLPSDLANYDFVISYYGKTSAVLKACPVVSTYFEALTDVQFSTTLNGSKPAYITYIPADTTVLQIEQSGDKYKIIHTSSDTIHYMGNAEGNAMCSDNFNESSCLWNLTFDGEGSVQMTTQATKNQYLGFNSSANPKRFKGYGTTMPIDMTLYMRRKSTQKEEPNISFEQESVKKYISDESFYIIPEGDYLEGEYSSSNVSIAEVDQNGKVTIKGEGECIIYFTSKETDIYTSKTISYTLVVVAGKIDPELGWNPEADFVECYEGDELQYICTSPYDDYDGVIVYSSEDTDVATINEEGSIIAKGTGMTVITATGTGSDIYKDAETSFLLTVYKDPMQGHKWLLLSLLMPYIDETATEEANKTTEYEAFNTNLHNDKLTWEDVRYFRTWLATLLYDSQIIDDYKTNEMLKYYKNEMVDDTVKHLKEFTDTLASTLVTTSSCGCGSSISTAMQNQSTTGVTILQGTSTSCGCGGTTMPTSISDLCDPLEKYQAAMRAFMVSIFSSIDFWLKYDKAFLLEIKKYIDAIIEFSPAFSTNDGISILRNCACEDQTLQNTAVQILRNVALAFQYMGTDDLSDHKNFITTSLNTWASTLYEKMIWK